MRILIRAKPSAKEESVKIIKNQRIENGREKMTSFIVSVKDPPKDGKANKAIAKAIAKHFGVALSRVRLVSGTTVKQKIFEID